MSSATQGQDELSRKQIINDLKAKLAAKSQSFTSLLETRTQSLRAQHSRRAQLVGTARPDAHLRKRGAASRGLSQRLMPGLSGLDDGNDGNENTSLLDMNRGAGVRLPEDSDTDMDSQRDADSNMDAPAFAALLQRGQVQVTDGDEDAYLSARADAVENIRATIEEVGSMYRRLQEMVLQQEEMTVRIDADVDESLVHVEEGHNELLKYLDSLSSGQWLLLKVLAIVLIFAIFFITVLA